MTIDYARLREQTMGSGTTRAVTVNTRALVDKILARYSSEHTTLRELIQNAADAGASKVVLKFETLPSINTPLPATTDRSVLLEHILRHHTLKTLVVSNNGLHFTPADWARLKRIAEGNPDETKIGAFGVGFYSVFADCDTPFVVSGSETMAFYWGEQDQKDSLLTREGTIPSDQPISDTTFMLDYRKNDARVPDLLPLSQFLAISLTFVALERIELWLDDSKLITLVKKISPSMPVPIPKNIKKRSPEKLLELKEVLNQSTQIDAEWMNVIGWKPPVGVEQPIQAEEPFIAGTSLKSFFSKITLGASRQSTAKKAAREQEAALQKAIAEDLTGKSRASIFLRVSTVGIKTHVSSSFGQELERATKKPAPQNTRIAILTSPFEETAASLSSMSGTTGNKAADIFASVLPSKRGRIFIGFPTAQTTGLLCHISAPSLIPTVERENIDLSARYVRTWNSEMLKIAGAACRIVYAADMENMKDALTRTMSSTGRRKVSIEDLATLIPSAIHVFKQYTFVESTPASQVGKLVEEAFWGCSNDPSIDILSSKGILPSRNVRIVSEKLSFLGGIPVVPEEITSGAEDFIRILYERTLISDMTILDIKKELDQTALNEEELSEFLKWCAAKMSTQELDQGAIQGLFSVAVAVMAHPNTEGTEASSTSQPTKVLLLGKIKSFVNVSKIPGDVPIPEDSIPFKFTKNVARNNLLNFGWEELQIVPWLRFILGHQKEMLTQPSFASHILAVVSKQWDSLSGSSKSTVTELLTDYPIISTRLGIKKPTEAYFPNVRIFEDLPVIENLPGVKEKFLAALGVRKTLELTFVFDRLLKADSQNKEGGAPKWSHVELIHYFASVSSEIPANDITRLKNAAIWPVEDNSDFLGDKTRQYRINELYEPSDALRSLGLPILKWTDFYRSGSQDGKFLSRIGLQRFPSMIDLCKVVAEAARSRNLALYEHALSYWIVNYNTNGYNNSPDATIADISFLPQEGMPFPHTVKPSQCFTDERASLFEFPILRKNLQDHYFKFGVAIDPPMELVVQEVERNPPKSIRQARQVFAYLTTRLPHLQGTLATKLSQALIVPVFDSEKRVRYILPTMCFLGNHESYSSIFDYVDFGEDANRLLQTLGAKLEPSVKELALIVAEDPDKMFSAIQEQKYFELLRRFSENTKTLKADKALWKALKESRFLLAFKEVPQESKNDRVEDDLDEQLIMKELFLAKASDIVVVDMISYYINFRHYVKAAPQDDLLETFYMSLGSPGISSIVTEQIRVSPAGDPQQIAARLRKRILQRCQIFLHEFSRDRVNHDTKWLEKNLTLQLASSISHRLTLKNTRISHTEKLTATLEKGAYGHVLSVIPDYDLFDVSRELINLLVKRPKKSLVLVLETILSNDLRRLRAKGYDVQRILQKEEQEMRLAESERRRQAEEDRRRREAEKKSEEERARSMLEKAGLAQAEQRKFHDIPTTANGEVRAVGDAPPPYHSPGRPKMPGAFVPDSPERSVATRSSVTGSEGSLIDRFEKLFNRGTLNTTHDPSHRNPRPGGKKSVNPTKIAVNEHQSLLSAVSQCRPYDSSSLTSRPRTTEILEETKGSYCDSTTGQDLSFVMEHLGMRIFVAKQLLPPRGSKVETTLSNLLGGSLPDPFIHLLHSLSGVFGMRSSILHVFYDPQSDAIGFNSGGAIFCNYFYFQKLHAQAWQAGKNEDKIHAFAYWWQVLCHELAHNLVSEHSAQHTFYTGAFAHRTFGMAMGAAMGLGNQGNQGMGTG